MNVITMPTNKQARPSSKRKTFDNTRELRDARVHAAIGLGYGSPIAPQNDNALSDRKAAKQLAELAKQLGATL
jgi:hypothetical protein